MQNGSHYIYVKLLNNNINKTIIITVIKIYNNNNKTVIITIAIKLII